MTSRMTSDLVYHMRTHHTRGADNWRDVSRYFYNFYPERNGVTERYKFPVIKDSFRVCIFLNKIFQLPFAQTQKRFDLFPKNHIEIFS